MYDMTDEHCYDSSLGLMLRYEAPVPVSAWTSEWVYGDTVTPEQCHHAVSADKDDNGPDIDMGGSM